LISDYVDIVLELFHLAVPQRIGSASVETKNGTRVMNIGPRIAPNPFYSSHRVFNDVLEYVSFLTTVKRQSVADMKPEEQQRAEETLSSVETKTISLLRSLSDPSLFRCVLTHADLHSNNILVDSCGHITAVLDWEVNYILPAILGAEYPIWLSDQGTMDPRFASDTYWWEESPEERQRLCAQFETVISSVRSTPNGYSNSLFSRSFVNAIPNFTSV